MRTHRPKSIAAGEDTLAIYVHVPFCEQKCAYCDFFTITDPQREHPLLDGWLQICLDELRLWRTQYPVLNGRKISSIFFGGGTPSLLSPESFARFLDAARRDFAFLPGAEISLETQPGTLRRSDFVALRKAGINRFSIGVQTFNDGLLRPTGRRHTVAQADETLQWARDTGAEVSLDLICALPGQSVGQWTEDLFRAVHHQPDHISAYEMTYHAGTDYYRQLRRGQIREPGDDVRAQMFRYTRQFLTDAGYKHYEISNYARPAHQSRHNQSYWKLASFLGLGAGAHGFIFDPADPPGRRFMNPRSAADYARSIGDGRLFAKPHDADDPDIRLVENLQMALRLTAGVDLNWLAGRLGQDIRNTRRGRLRDLVERGWLSIKDDRMKLTKRGHLFADSVAESFL